MLINSHGACLSKDVPSESSASGPPGPQVAQLFAEEVGRLLGQQLEVSLVSLKTYREKLQVGKQTGGCG